MKREEYYARLSSLVGRDCGLSPVVGDVGQILQALHNGQGPDNDGALLTLVDELPKLSLDELSSVLDGLEKWNRPFLAVIPTRYSDRVLDTGFNEFQTVEPQEWWLNRLKAAFETVTSLPIFQESDVVVVNRKISREGVSAIQALLKRSPVSKEIGRMRNRMTLAWRRFRGSTVSQQQLFRDLEGKRVAVVGNARSLALTQFGPAIDANDIVIRFNRVPIVSRASHGYRTDWVAAGVPFDTAFLQHLGASRGLWMSTFRRKMTADTLQVEPLYIHLDADIRALAAEMGVERPTTGMMIIDLLRRSKCTQVELYGFDFYVSQSSSGHQTVEAAPHDFQQEERFVTKLLERDKRFVLCK